MDKSVPACITVTAIDGDVLVYQAAWAAENDSPAACKHTLDKMISRIVDRTEADEYVVFLTGVGNFRDTVATTQPYKGNRADTAKPKHYVDAREHLCSKHSAIVVDDCEADDALGEFLSNVDSNYHFICATIDKDLLMVPGHHYRWEMTRKGKVFPEEHTFISPEEGAKRFFLQMLTGDSTDNIPGLYRFTGQKATKKVKERLDKAFTSNDDMFQEVWDIYEEALLETGPFVQENLTAFLDEIGQLLWIRHGGESDWKTYYQIQD